MEQHNNAEAAPQHDMSACIVGHVTVKDAARWAEYCAKVPATIAPWGGRLVLRGKRIAVLSGQHSHQDVVVIQFPDAQSVRGWHESPEYQALIPIREKAVELVLISYDC